MTGPRYPTLSPREGRGSARPWRAAQLPVRHSRCYWGSWVSSLFLQILVASVRDRAPQSDDQVTVARISIFGKKLSEKSRQGRICFKNLEATVPSGLHSPCVATASRIAQQSASFSPAVRQKTTPSSAFSGVLECSTNPECTMGCLQRPEAHDRLTPAVILRLHPSKRLPPTLQGSRDLERRRRSPS
jgi:hypothetical protein